MSVTRLVVVGASAGGIEAITRLAATMPSEFPAAVCVVLHSGSQSPGVLHGILDRAGPLTAHAVHGGERPQPGHIYVAPPDHHLVVEPNRLRLTKGPRENRFRPGDRSIVPIRSPGVWASSHWRRADGKPRRWNGGAVGNQAAGRRGHRAGSRPTRRFPPCRPVPFSTSTSTMSCRSRPWRRCWPASWPRR